MLRAWRGCTPPAIAGASLAPCEVDAFLGEIEAWLARTGVPSGMLGRWALNHGGFVNLLRKRRTARATVAAVVRAFMARWPDGCTAQQALNAAAEDRAAKAAAAKARSVAQAPGLAAAPAAEPRPSTSLGTSGETSLQREIAAEAASRGEARRVARKLSGTHHFGIVPASTVEAVQLAMLETPEDLFAFLRRRWPHLLGRIVHAARGHGKTPAMMIADLLELGLAETDPPLDFARDDRGMAA